MVVYKIHIYYVRFSKIELILTSWIWVGCGLDSLSAMQLKVLLENEVNEMIMPGLCFRDIWFKYMNFEKYGYIMWVS